MDILSCMVLGYEMGGSFGLLDPSDIQMAVRDSWIVTIGDIVHLVGCNRSLQDARTLYRVTGCQPMRPS